MCRKAFERWLEQDGTSPSFCFAPDKELIKRVCGERSPEAFSYPPDW